MVKEFYLKLNCNQKLSCLEYIFFHSGPILYERHWLPESMCKKDDGPFPNFSHQLLFAHPLPHPSFSHLARVRIYWDRDAQLIRTVSRSLGNQGAQSTAGRGAKKLKNHLGGTGSMLQLKCIIYLNTDKEEITSCWWSREGSRHFLWTLTSWRDINR